MTDLLQSGRPWALPWQSVHEFFSVVTFLMEGPRDWMTIHDVLRTSGVVGPKVHDARIAAICIEHGVSTLWSADRDFSKFRGLKIVNPLH